MTSPGSASRTVGDCNRSMRSASVTARPIVGSDAVAEKSARTIGSRLSTCCQLSEYGFNENDVVADLTRESLREAWPRYLERLGAQREASAPRAEDGDEFDAFPCIRCARVTGKMTWARAYPHSTWSGAAFGGAPELVRLVAR